MSNIRFFSGSRDSGRLSAASELMKIEILKKGKLPSADRYKRILKKKFDENKKKALANVSTGIKIPGSIAEARKLTKTAEAALKEISIRKATRESKAMRSMVIVQPRTFQNGLINKKGKIYDVAGNLVAQVNTKNGKMASMMGWEFGKYKPKSYYTNVLIQDAINRYSPYFIQQRKLQMLQQQGVEFVTSHGPMNADVINVHGAPATHAAGALDSNTLSMGPRQNIGVTAWGARSDNVWGTYADNAWGVSADNVWGGNSTDVWGGVGVGGLWGSKGPNIWGTGNGRNYLAKLTGAIMALFGLSTKGNREKLRALNARASSGPRSGGSPATPRSSARTSR